MQAKLREAARRRAGHERVAEALRALAPGAFASLPQHEREAVRLYYGIGDGAPRGLGEVADRLGISRWRAGQAVGRAVASLLDPSVGGAAGRWCVGASAVCGTRFTGPPRQKTCSAPCSAQLARAALRRKRERPGGAADDGGGADEGR